MYKIIDKKILNENVTSMTFYAPYIASRAQAGQFVVVNTDEFGERIPLTVSNSNIDNGSITVVFQTIGKTTKKLSAFNVNESVLDLCGPLGKPTCFNDQVKRLCVIGGGVGTAIALPVSKKYHEQYVDVTLICGFKNSNSIILTDELTSACNNLIIMTDDGSNGNKGFVTEKLLQLLENNVTFDQVFAVGPIPMMKAVSLLTKQYDIPTTVSLNPIMVDGIGMCGGCRVIVDNQVKFACVDGPEFDGHKVDFDSLKKRNSMYDKNHKCNLTKE